MQTKHLCVLIHIWTKGEVGAQLSRFKPSSKIFYWPFQGGASFVDHLCYFCLVFMHVCLLMLCGHLLGKGWSLGSRLWCLIVTLSLSHWYPGSGVVLDCIYSWSLPSFLLIQLLCYEVYLLETICICVLTVRCWNLVLFLLLLPVKCISQRHRHTVKNIKTSTKEGSLYTCLKAG